MNKTVSMQSPYMTAARVTLILVSTSMMVWYMHFREIDIPKKIPRMELHSQIVDRTAPSPYRYRVLVPYVAEGMTRVFGPALGSDRAFVLAYGLVEAASIIALILILYGLCAQFFAPLPSLVGALIANLSLVVALRDHYFQPWSLVNAVSFALAALLLFRRRTIAFLLLVALSSFNRETSALLPVLYLATAAERKHISRHVLVFVLACAVWSAGYLLVRFVQGGAPHIYQVSEIFEKNLAAKNLGYLALNLILFLGFVWLFAARGLRRSPPFIKRLALFIPLYLPFVFVFGVWKEVRLLMPLYPVLIPAALSWLFPRKGAEERTQGA
jgi:hypothetical protein